MILAEDTRTKNILEQINKSALKFLAPLVPEKAYAIIVEEAVKLAKAEYGAIFLERNGVLERIYASSPLLFRNEIRKKGFTYRAFKTRRASIKKIKEVAKIHPYVKKMGIKTTIFIPLSYRKKSIGVLSVDSFKDRKFTERELEILKLFGSLASMAIRKTELYNEAQKALEIRDVFVSMAAHELRTPLTTTTGYVQLLQKRFAENATIEAKWINGLSLACRRLTDLINKMLQVNRMRAGQLHYDWENCSLKEITQRALGNFSFSHGQDNIIFEDQLNGNSDVIVGDFDKLLQVISYILENAAKFSPIDRKIHVVLKQDSSSLIIQVMDYGKGIDKKDLPYILDAFYKGRENYKEGMGVGLFLAKHIITRHHGNIKVASEKNKGTTVQIKLPKAKS